MGRDIRRDEFEGRNRQLPADLDQSGAYKGSAKARNDLANTPLGTPPNCFDVRSVYDSRPINGTDFNIIANYNFLPNEAAATAILEMTVPEGYVAVLRKTRIWFEPVYGQNRSDVTVSFTLNGGDVPYNVDLLVGGDMSDIESFIIGNEFNRLGMRVTLNNGLQIDDDFECYVWFYGNLLLKTDRPAVFEIANPVLSGNCAPTPNVKAPARPALTPVAIPSAQAPLNTPTAAAPVAPPKLAISNVVSANGKGGARVVVHDPQRATIPGGYRALSREEYTQYKLQVDNYVAANKRFAPTLQPLVS